MTLWWLSSRAMTVGVETRAGRIVTAPPIVRRFIGQHIDALRGWMGRQRGYAEEMLP